jgi:hypothetical protein
MATEIRDSTFLKLKLSRSDNERQPVSFLVGAPFSLDDGVGVPNVEGFLEVVRNRVAQSGPQFLTSLEGALSGSSGALRYQTAMGFVYDTLDAQAAADIVRTAVLRARKPGLPTLDLSTSYDGSPDEWQITRAQRGLARAMHLDPDRFPGPIFTTNFDPLIELALRDQGFIAKTANIPLDGSITAPVKSSKTEADVFHLHGFWRDSATLHRPQQLLAPRPQLQQSLQRHLDGTHLVVMAYGGWDDIFTTAIANCLNDPGFRGTLSWCFYNENPAIVEAENKTLFTKFSAGVAQGKISFFCGIDCHAFFDELIDALDFSSAVRTAVEDSPIPGWQLVTQEALDSEPPLTGAEAVRFFDGAVPTLRHATSPLIPRLSYADRLISRLSVGDAGDCKMQLLRAAGGEGKSTALLQAAAEAARGGEWAVLYRPATDAGLNPEVVAQLDPSRKWLLVADNAEDLIGDIWSAAVELHRLGRQNVFFMLAARDTDWRLKDGDARGWATRLIRLADLTIGRIDGSDAGLVVDAWAAQGEDGLRALKDAATREIRVAMLVRAAGVQDVQQGEGSFFGGLLETRFGAAGLVDHLLPLLEPLRNRRLESGTGTLFDSLLYVANCHATGMPGLDKPVLADLVGVPPWRLASLVLHPLGVELGIAESSQYVLTRHRKTAAAILEVAATRYGIDLSVYWRAMVKAMVSFGRVTKVGPTYGMIVHAGARLKRDLPQALAPDLRGEIGIAAAEAAMAAVPKWSSTIVDLARALRSAGYPQDACDLLRRKIPDLKKSLDKAQNIRSYFYEWSTSSGNLGDRQGSIMSAWLAACSLSDALPVDVTSKDAKVSCAGLGVAFEHLIDGRPCSVYAKGRRAVTELGWQTSPDQRTASYFARYEREVDALGTPKPVDNGEALRWLAEAAFAAWQELDDSFLRSLKSDGQLTFQRLQKTLSTR